MRTRPDPGAAAGVLQRLLRRLAGDADARVAGWAKKLLAGMSRSRRRKAGARTRR